VYIYASYAVQINLSLAGKQQMKLFIHKDIIVN